LFWKAGEALLRDKYPKVYSNSNQKDVKVEEAGE